MSGIKYEFKFDGLQKGATDMLFAESAAKKLGTTLAGIQGARGSIPGLATTPGMIGGSGDAHILQSPAFMAMGARALSRMGSIVPAGPPPSTLQAFFNQSMGIGAGQMRMTGASRAGYQNFWKQAVPPMIQPHAPINWKLAGLGAIAAPFSPWLGARAMSSAFGGFLGGGGAGGAAAAIFGAGGLPVFIAAFTAIRLTVEGLRKAFEELHKGVQEGAKLFQEAAKTGTGTSQLFQMKSALSAIGVSPEMAESLLLRGEHPLRGGGATMRVPGVDMPLGAGRGTAQIGELQQIKNLSAEFAHYWSDAAADSVAMSTNAKELFQIQGEITALSREWRTMWASIATDLGPAILYVLDGIKDVFKLINVELLFITSTLQGLGLIAKGDPGKAIIPTPGHHRGGGGAWERMGFNIGGAGTQDYARETAVNTRTIARVLTKQDRLSNGRRDAQNALSFMTFGIVPYNAP